MLMQLFHVFDRDGMAQRKTGRQLYLCWTYKRKRLLNINIQYSWSGGKSANKRRLLESQWRPSTRNGPRRPNLWRMRQIIPKTNFGHRLKLWTRADLSSVSSLHDKSSWNEPAQEWEYQSRNPLKNPINPNGTGVGWKMRALLRIPEQAHKRNTRSRTLSDLWKNGRVPVRVEKNPRFPGVYWRINSRRLGFL